MFYAYDRPKYQMSVYRSIGPLVIFCVPKNTKKNENKELKYLVGKLNDNFLAARLKWQ